MAGCCSRTTRRRSGSPRSEGEGDARAVEEGRRRDRRQAQGPGNLAEADRDKLDAQRRTRSRAGDGPWPPSDDAKFGNTLTVPHGDRHVELPRADLLPHGWHGGASPHPHAVLHDAVREGGAHLRGVVPLLHLSPVLHGAGLCRVRPLRRLHQAGRRQDQRACRAGSRSGSRPGCSRSSTRTATASCSGRTSSSGRTDFVVLSMPEVAGLPFVITGLVMAGGLAAALSTADGLAAHHRQRHLTRSLLQRHRSLRLAGQAADDHESAARGDGARVGVHRHVPLRRHRGAGGVGLQPGGRVILPGARHGHLVEAREQARGRRGG